MEEAQLEKNQVVISRPPSRTFFTRRLPFIAVLALAIIGVAYAIYRGYRRRAPLPIRSTGLAGSML